jgi:hypothetical protein
MCAVAIAATLSGACGPAGGDGGTAGSGGSTSGSGGSGTGGTTGSGGDGSGVAGTVGTGGSTSGSGGSTSGSGGSTSGSGGSSSGSGGSTSGSGGSSSGSGGSSSGSGGSSSGSGGSSSGSGGSSSGSGGSSSGSGGSASGRGGSSTGGSTAGSGGSGTGGTGGNGTGTGGSSTGPVYNPNFVEFYGADCQVADPKDVNVAGKLNDLFEKLDGTKIAKKSDWKCRRAELVKVVEKYIHGPKPGKPEMVTGTVTNSAITVNVSHMGKSTSFSVSVSLPTGTTGPVPIIIGMGGSSLNATLVRGEGVATGSYNHQEMASETSRSGKFTTIYGTGTGASAQVGWAWGISRVIDVLVAEKAAGRNNIIDPTAVGVTGCSRNGKAAFTVGAWDERIALGIPHESGTGGVSAFRIVNTNPRGPNNMTAQTLSSAWTEAQGWFGVPFGTYRSKVDTIPGDTHALAAMYAPRGLLVLDNSRIGELCASCQHAATAAAGKVYEALGVGKNVAYNGGNPSDPHNHCTFYEATQGEPLRRAIRAHLTKKAAADGRMEPQPAGTADLAKWVPWTAPTLTDDVSFNSPPVTK